tara:strand:- start:109 stop:354 length:246 start_codon:yes stop_codon:yes gene_type:complete
MKQFSIVVPASVAKVGMCHSKSTDTKEVCSISSDIAYSKIVTATVRGRFAVPEPADKAMYFQAYSLLELVLMNLSKASQKH